MPASGGSCRRGLALALRGKPYSLNPALTPDVERFFRVCGASAVSGRGAATAACALLRGNEFAGACWVVRRSRCLPQWSGSGSGEGGEGFGECQTGDGNFAVAAVEGAEADGGGFGVVGVGLH